MTLRQKLTFEDYRQHSNSEIEHIFQEKGYANAAKLLSVTWKKQVSQNESISHRRWLKSEKWLNDYVENFKQSHVNSNQYFKLEVQENATYAEVTSYPKKKTPTYQQSFKAVDPQPMQQTTLETIQTLLQQVHLNLTQRHHNSKDSQQEEPTEKRHNRRHPNTIPP